MHGFCLPVEQIITAHLIF